MGATSGVGGPSSVAAQPKNDAELKQVTAAWAGKPAGTLCVIKYADASKGTVQVADPAKLTPAMLNGAVSFTFRTMSGSAPSVSDDIPLEHPPAPKAKINVAPKDAHLAGIPSGTRTPPPPAKTLPPNAQRAADAFPKARNDKERHLATEDLQRGLAWFGCEPKGGADGEFGKNTEASLKEFNAKFGFPADTPPATTAAYIQTLMTGGLRDAEISDVLTPQLQGYTTERSTLSQAIMDESAKTPPDSAKLHKMTIALKDFDDCAARINSGFPKAGDVERMMFATSHPGFVGSPSDPGY